MPSIFDDPRLLEAFRAGDELALSAIYRRYVEAVAAHVAFLARATGAPELAQPSAVADLLQEVFTRAFSANARSAYDEHRPSGPYLNRIAKNCFIDLLRKRRHDLARELHDPASLDRGPCGREDDDSVHRLLAVVDAYVSELSEPLRDVYERRFAMGLTQKATCDVLGITRRALRTAEAHLKQGAREALCVAGVLAQPEGSKRRTRSETAGSRATSAALLLRSQRRRSREDFEPPSR
ncbi:MAG TPA: sigma-70 family RNA polymerase sigma factor [Polyangiaceae bacterium]|nr:sigma-70 family RNA polymerase sigma factor [Polyangiaceae bacterium]